MSKSFTCRELIGICDQSFSGNTFIDIAQKGMEHMQSDTAHQAHMTRLREHGQTSETREEWFERMQKEFEARAEDA